MDFDFSGLSTPNNYSLPTQTEDSRPITKADIQVAELMSSPEFVQRMNQASKAFNNNDRLQDTTVRVANAAYDIIKVESIGEHGALFYRSNSAIILDDKSKASTITSDELNSENTSIKASRTFRRLRTVDAERIVSNIMFGAHNITTANKVKASVDTLNHYVGGSMDKIENNLFEVANGIYWDVVNAQIVEEEKDQLSKDPNSPLYRPLCCMRALFDSNGTSEIKISPEGILTPVVKTIYKATLKHLEENDGLILPDDISGESMCKGLDFSSKGDAFSPFWVWANEDIETFNDLLKAVSTNFMAHKPKGAFVLIGLKRNGKSTFVKMLHTLFGRNNTSMVRLSDFNNHGLNGDLWTTMMNAPDEEDEGTGNEILSVQGNFKSIAAHESLKLRRLYAQGGQWVNSDFMCFFPMNHFPEWKGSGAAACLHRTFPLFFENDLSKYDNVSKDFAKETFTEWFFTQLLGVVFAIAAYYKDRPLEFSDKMKANKEKVDSKVDNALVYINQLTTLFDGYSTKRLVYRDYCVWCRDSDCEPQSQQEFFQALEFIPHNVTSINVDGYGYAVNIHKFATGRKTGRMFHDFAEIPEFGNRRIPEIINGEMDRFGRFIPNSNHSVVHGLFYRVAQARVPQDQTQDQSQDQPTEPEQPLMLGDDDEPPS